MFKVGPEGKGHHFWINDGELTPLLVWHSAAGITMQLHARTFTNEATGNQWFKEIEMTRDGVPVLRVLAKDATRDDGSRAWSFDKGGIREAGPMQVDIDGTPIRVGAHESVAHRKSKRAALSVSVSNHERKLRAEAKTRDGPFVVELVSARAAKFDDRNHKDASVYQHLNLHLVSGIPRGSTGVFAELAGSQPMSAATRALLVRPPSARKRRYDAEA